MKSIPQPVVFEWDAGNKNKNLIKHNVTNQEAEEAFGNKPFTISEDKMHSSEEERRFQALGKSNRGRKLFLSFTIRNDTVRIISARDMSRKERIKYEKV